MTRFNTGNPINSLAEEDFYDNCLSLDQAMNSTEPTWRDRFNVEKPTIDAALKSAGFMPAGFDFVTGGTLQPGDRNKAVYNPAPNGDNNWYRWNGVFPKEIAANSQPNPKDENNWVLAHFRIGIVEKEALRRSYAEAGLNLVDGSFEAGGTVTTPSDVLLYEADSKAYSWDGALPKVVPVGSTPATSGGIGAGAWVDRTDVTLRSDLASKSGSGLVGYQPAGTGAVATTVQSKLRETVSVTDFYANGVSGARVDPTGVIDSTAGIQAAIDAAFMLGGADVFFPAGNYKCGVLTMRQNVSLRGMGAIQGGASRITCTGAYAFKTNGTHRTHFFNIYNLTVIGIRGTTDFIDQSLGGSWGYSTIVGCYFVNFRYVDLLVTGNRYKDNNFQNAVYCRFRGADFTVSDNFFGFDDQDTTRTAADYFVSIHAASGVDFTGNYITSMRPAANPPIPLVVQTSSTDVRLYSNWLDGGQSRCLLIYGGSARILAHGNRMAVVYPAECIPVELNNVTDIQITQNIIIGLNASAPFVTFNGPLERCEVLDNIVNSRTDATIHGYTNATNNQDVRMRGYGLAVKNFSASGDIVPALYGSTITNQGSTGVIFIYVYPRKFKAGNFFNFTRTDTTKRMIFNNVESGSNIYDSDTAGFNRGRVFSYADGSVVVEQM